MSAPLAKHACAVRFNAQVGMYYSQCSCGYESPSALTQSMATAFKDAHLQDIMKPDPMAIWSLWMQSDLPKEIDSV